ncbi:protein EXPORTIN 1A-like isoform X2 [Eucalyptus grandis]|uniref:protein EXPORTIN 1A-like isoform X2 n=1 Tax=Eucalyptus grandis TaxID=71139 RepID=UPI00192EEDCF|nr:protein EXPORTIN 1A-like isoform X2 [Eucalyptus grandis]
MAAMANNLRGLSQPIDVASLDAIVSASHGTGSEEERAAEQILGDLENDPSTWLQVRHILQDTKNLKTKLFALKVLEGVVKNRWNALPHKQRDWMKNYISQVIMQLSSNEASLRMEKLFINTLNIISVQILKREWPGRWRSFFPYDLVLAATTSETIRINYMAILTLLSEDLYDFSRGEMTEQKIKELEQSLNSELQLIYELCSYVLSATQRTELMSITLSTLCVFLPGIPLGYIFKSPLLEMLLEIIPVPSTSNLTLQCLTLVATRNSGNIHDLQFVNMYKAFMVQLQAILPPTANIPEAYAHGSSEQQAFIQKLALFFTSFYKVRIRILESTQEDVAFLLLGLEYLVNISYVEDTEVFMVCLDYWNTLVLELFQMPSNPGMVNDLGSKLLQRQQLYANPLSKLRMLILHRMAKPEIVLIVEDEKGNSVRETMKDENAPVQYKRMKDILFYLSCLGHEDTEKQMLKLLSKRLSGEDWLRNNLNTLYWAIGSISGSMMDAQVLLELFLI